jgi:DNA-binding NtrC family response regulator
VKLPFGRGNPPLLTPAVTPVVALIRNDHDRARLSEIAGQEHLEVHFADTCSEAWNAINRLQSPVVLCERDLPHIEWQDAVRILATALSHPCVILTSPVVDDYVLREIVMRGGYDVLATPLRCDDAARTIRLAMTYWKITRKTAPAFRK